jgi:hypothetical protein
VKHYPPTPIFRLATVLLVLGAILLGRQAWHTSDRLLAIFAVGVAVVAFFMILGSLAVADFDGHTLSYRTPLRGSRRLDREQIARVEMGGRRFRALVIGYHPRGANGLIQVEQMQYINLAPLQGQEELLELLGGETEDAG